MISAIVAVDNNWGIGYKGELLESIPEDLQNFKLLTLGGTVIMGQNTWDSLPKKPLPGRENIIITYDVHPDDKAFFWSMEDTLDFIKKHIDKNYYVIGGGTIYKQLLPLCDRVYLTKIYKSHDNIDTYFPNLDEMPGWAKTSLSNECEYENIKYQFWLYERVN